MFSKGDDTIDAETGTTTSMAINNDIVNAGTVTVEGTTLQVRRVSARRSNRQELGR